MKDDITIILPPHQLEMLQDILGRVTPKGYNEKVFVSGLRALKKGDKVPCESISIAKN